MLNISPFTYGLGIVQIYDQGNTFPPNVLDIGEEQLFAALGSAISTVAAISLALNFPTLPSVMHSLVNGYKKVLAVAIETDYAWEGIEELKDRIANPDAYAATTVAATPAAGDTKVEEKEEEKEDEEDSDEGGFGDLLYVYPSPVDLMITLLTRNAVANPAKSNHDMALWYRIHVT
jgi:large subunit ribosomal protein LP0